MKLTRNRPRTKNDNVPDWDIGYGAFGESNIKPMESQHYLNTLLLVLKGERAKWKQTPMSPRLWLIWHLKCILSLPCQLNQKPERGSGGQIYEVQKL